MTHAYIFYGKSGSGKGTQAKKLETYLLDQGRKVLVVETGKLFRDFIENTHTFAAHQTQAIIDKGNLMPAFFPIYMWAHELIQKYEAGYDIILDGVTRRIEEAPILESALAFFQFSKMIIFHIHIDDTTAHQRLALRSGNRADDHDVVRVQTRLDWYHEEVIPVINYFKEGNTVDVVDINGELDREEVFEQIKAILPKN